LVGAGIPRDAAGQLVRLALETTNGRWHIAHPKQAQCLDALREVARSFCLKRSDHVLVALT
jgi:hypothetical protein